MTPQRLLLGLLAVVVAAIVAYAFLHEDAPGLGGGDALSPETSTVNPPPALRGAGEGARPVEADPSPQGASNVDPVDPPRTVVGRVVDASGRPVEGARIYLVPKGQPGLGMAQRSTAPLAVTSADGRWALQGVSTAGHWIGAHAGDHVRPALVDGDALGAGDVELALPDSALLRVTTRMAHGELEEGTTPILRCHPPAQVDTWGFPAPGTPFFFDVKWPLEGNGVTSIPLPSGTPVEVRLEDPYVYAEPERIVVDGLPATIHFDLFPQCFLSVRLLDQDEGKPLRLNTGIAVGDPETPVGTVGWTQTGAWPDQDGIVALPLGRRPGTYAVHVKAAGYRDVQTEVTFAEPGEDKAIDVRLERAPEVGLLRLELAHGEAVPANAAFVTVMRPSSGGAWRSKPEAARLGIEGGVTRIDIEALPAGVYDVMVWMRPSARVGYAMSVAVHGSVATEQRIQLVEGDVLELEKGRPGDIYVRLEAPPVGRLPLIAFWGTSYSVMGERVNKHARALGPYPFENLEPLVRSQPFEKR